LAFQTQSVNQEVLSSGSWRPL